MYPFMLSCEPLTEEQCRLVEENQNLVYSAVHSFINEDKCSGLFSFYDFEDLVSIGNFALYRAVQTYDPSKAQLSTWIVNAVKQQLKFLLDYSINRNAPIVNDDLCNVACTKEYNDPSIKYEKTVEASLVKEAISRAKLSEPEKQVIDMTIKKEMKQVEVARKLKRSRSQICRLRKSALGKIEKEYLKLIG